MIVGSALFSLQFFLCVAFLSSVTVMGVSDPRFAEMAKRYFLWRGVAFAGLVLFAHAAVGAALAALCACPVSQFHSKRLRWGVWLVLFATLHATFLLRDIHLHPQNYVEILYSHAGWRKALQVWITDGVPMRVAEILPWMLCGVMLLPPALRWAVRRPLPASAAVGFVVSVVFYFQWSPSPIPNAGPNIVLIAVDSLRSDRLFTKATPNLSRLAREGVLFTRAYPDVARTFPSMVTMLTGRYALRHGIRTMFPRWEDREAIGGSLPRFLADQGYTTAVAADYAGDVFPRANLGFQHVDTPDFNAWVLMQQRILETQPCILPYLSHPWGMKVFPVLREFTSLSDPSWLTDRAERWTRRLSREGEFFLTVFYSTAHFPYSAPAPDYRKFTDPSYRGPFKYHKFNRIDLPDEDLTAEDIGHIRGLYDGAVFAVDREVGRLIDKIRNSPLGANTLIVLTADHGENLFEHGWMGHGDELWSEEGLRVPILVWGPGLKPSRVDQPVSLVDLTPTLLDWAGLNSRYGMTDGKSLLPQIRGKEPLSSRSLYMETASWFVPHGPARFHRERIPYPSVLDFTELDPDRRFELVLRPEYETVLVGAKHRAIVRNDHRLVYVPLRDGPRYELLKIEDGEEILVRNPSVMEGMRRELVDSLKSMFPLHEWQGFLIEARDDT